jgi:hypothetical protein
MNHPQEPHPADPNRPIIPQGRPSDLTGGGQYYGGKDVENGRTHRVTIASIIWETLTDGRGQTDQYLVCHFREEGSKGLVLKPETMKSMIDATGIDDFGAWIGLQVEIYGVSTAMGLGARARRPLVVASPTSPPTYQPEPPMVQQSPPSAYQSVTHQPPNVASSHPSPNAYSQPVTPHVQPHAPRPSDVPF